jgi:RecA/RadA recombinase
MDSRQMQSESKHTESKQMDDSRKKALVAALGQIEKQFGKGSVMRLGDASASYDVEA